MERPSFLILTLLLLSISNFSCTNNGGKKEDKVIPKKLLIEDSRQLLSVIEDVHPNPYKLKGGKMALNKEFQLLLTSIPENGLTREEFISITSRFMANLKEGHSYINTEVDYNFDGLPFLFYVVEKYLYIIGVFKEEHTQYFGSRVVSVEGIPFPELLSRMDAIKGADNIYGTLSNLGNFELYLSRKKLLQELIPEWKETNKITCEFKLPSDEVIEVTFDIQKPPGTSIIKTPSKLSLPEPEATQTSITYFDSLKTMYLRVKGMMWNRETLEKRATFEDIEADAREYYFSIYNKYPKGSFNEFKESLPSLTDRYKNLVEKMRQTKAENLVIDLRSNVGGFALTADILIYFLFGKDSLIEVYRKSNIVTRRLSALNGDLLFAPNESSYDSTMQRMLSGGKLPLGFTQKMVESDLKLSPTFYSEYQSKKYSHYYQPKNIFVISNAATFSAGFMFLKYFQLLGASVVGVSSSQNVNHYGEVVNFKLKNTEVGGSISHSYIQMDTSIPESNRSQNILFPDHELTYDKLRSYHFDSNAEVLFTLEIIKAAMDSLY